MSNPTITNIAHSVNVRLKNFAVKKQISFDYLLLRYALERFLFRLSVSPHIERFILKGASAFSVWMGPTFRVTRDADLYCPGNSNPDFLIEITSAEKGRTKPPMKKIISHLHSASWKGVRYPYQN